MVMNKACNRTLFIGASVFIMFLQGCCLQCLTHEGYARKEREEQEAQYAPYRQRNTVEAYREFIQKYPKNMFVSRARYLIETFEFDPYEKADTMEGYMEFAMMYPDNPNVKRAVARIEQMEFKRYESMDTIEGYREFLVKYPNNPYTMLAKERLQELEFRALDGVLQKKYGFDLLMYRLQIKRVQQEVQADAGMQPGDFALFASLETVKKKEYFHTHLIYARDLSELNVPLEEFAGTVFKTLITKMLSILDARFINAAGIYGFSFDMSSSEHRFHGDKKVFAEYQIPVEAAHLFAAGKLDQPQLLAACTLVTYDQSPDAAAKSDAVPADTTTAAALDGNALMQSSQECRQCADAIITRSWRRSKKNGSFDTVETVEKWKSFGAADGVVEKSVLRYMIGYGGNLAKKQAAAILTISFTDQPREFWYVMCRGDAGRTPHIDSYRPTAEEDFPLADYKDIPPEREKHALQGTEECAHKRCFVVESTPVSEELPYGRRISWIDGQALTPIKIDYFDKNGALWKSASIAWQNKCGRWFWEQAVVENVQTGDVTTITTKDVRVNVGLPDRDFTPHALQRLTGK